MKLNKKGSAIVELIISIVIFATIVLIVSNFKVYLATHEASIKKQTALYTSIDNVVADLYSEGDWDNLKSNFIIDTGMGKLQVHINNLGITANNTNLIVVKFEFHNLERTEKLERSVYYNE